MKAEAWTAIAGAPGYAVSSWGRVRKGAEEVLPWERRGELVVTLEVRGRRRTWPLEQLLRPTCRFGHPRDQRYRDQAGDVRRRCARCRRVTYRRRGAAVAGVRSLLDELLSP